MRTILVSPQDRHLLDSTWTFSRGYVRRKVKGKEEYLHRVIMQAPPGIEVDHINGDRADCRRENLRLCTHKENARGRFKGGLGRNNRSGYLGVRSFRGRWRAQIKVDGKFIHLGVYDDPRIAAAAYDGAARFHFGEFATLNFPGSTYR